MKVEADGTLSTVPIVTVVWAVADAAILLGSEDGVSINAQQMARWAGTISYAVLCGIHARVKRVYVD